jgi:hypothetical protein
MQPVPMVVVIAVIAACVIAIVTIVVIRGIEVSLLVEPRARIGLWI